MRVTTWLIGILMVLLGIIPFVANAVDPGNFTLIEKQELDLILGSDECRSLIRKKRRVTSQLSKKLAYIQAEGEKGSSLGSPEERSHVVALLDSQLRQLSSLESFLMVGIVILKEALSGERDLDAIIVEEKLLLKVQLASLLVQEEASKAWTLEKSRRAEKPADQSSNSTSTGDESEMLRDAMSQILENVAESVDKVEKRLDDHSFERAVKVEGAHFVTVVTVNEDGGEIHPNDPSNSGNRQAIKLIDQQNNQFSLSRPRDTTVPVEDSFLIADGLTLIVSSFFLGTLFNAFSLPIFFGHLLAGIVLGPSGLNWITNLVQIETLGQFGVYFILFVLGLEFNMEKLRKNSATSIWGTTLLMVLTMVSLCVLGWFLDTRMNEAVLIGACVALSSTAVVLKCLDNNERISHAGQVLFGVLVVQDVLLGLVLALFPLLETSDNTGIDVAITLFSLLFRTMLFFLICVVIMRFVVDQFLTFLAHTKSSELFMFGAISLCFSFLKLSDFFGLSAEVGAFAAGLIMSNEPSFAEKALHSIEILRDFFSAIFFASIGFHIYPTFLYQQGTSLIIFSLSAVGFKFLTSYVVFRRLFRLASIDCLSVAIGLSQISEFSFVVASRGKKHGIISRESYFLILGTTALTLLLTPLLFKLIKFRRGSL